MKTTVGQLAPADRLLCAIYAALAIGALVSTQTTLAVFMTRANNGGVSRFLQNLHGNPAATFVSLDLLFVAAAAVVFMVVEGRRLRLTRWWIYVALTFVIAVSVALPLFLIARQLHLRATPAS